MRGMTLLTNDGAGFDVDLDLTYLRAECPWLCDARKSKARFTH
jgi:hypothetical protein